MIKYIKRYFLEKKRKKRLLFIKETNLRVAELEQDGQRLKDALIYLMKQNEANKEIMRIYNERE